MKVVKTILRAFLFGIGVGILLAPRAGSETRRLLSERLNKLMDSAGELADNFSGGSSDTTSTSYVPSQHYNENTTSREVGTPADRMSM
jgi:gas vesicle protein